MGGGTFRYAKVPGPGIEPMPQQRQGWTLTAGPPAMPATPNLKPDLHGPVEERRKGMGGTPWGTAGGGLQVVMLWMIALLWFQKCLQKRNTTHFHFLLWKMLSIYKSRQNIIIRLHVPISQHLPWSALASLVCFAVIPTHASLILFCFFFGGGTPWTYGGSRARGLQLPAYTTATATPDLSCICNLHHSSQQRRILNSLREARDRTRVLRDSSWIRFCCVTMGTPLF